MESATKNFEASPKNQTVNWEALRDEFPVLRQKVNGKPLIYLDNAATTQKPKSVLDALNHYYRTDNANIHRGIHTLAERATRDFEDTRKAIRSFINAKEAEEVIFTKGTTEGINLVASSYGRTFIGKDDEIIITSMEHHSNIVPWQLLCEEKGARLKVIPINEDGEILLDAFKNLLSEKTKLVSIVHVSNSLGTVNPVKEVIDQAHKTGAVVLVDGAQAAAHLDLDVQALDCDFYVFSAHKMFGPTGVGALYGKRELLDKMPPYQGGGEMIKNVSFEKTTFNDIPYKFEAGTPNIGDVIAFKEALTFINRLGKENIRAHEEELLAYGHEQLATIPGIRIIGNARHKMNVIAFVIEGIFHFDIGQLLDTKGIAVRTGHHCTQPLMEIYGIEGTVRASFSVYNTKEEIDFLTESLRKLVKMMRK